MKKNNFYLKGEEKFGPISSRLYSLFASRVARYYYNYIVEDIRKIRPKRMLDVGCGPGTIINMLVRVLPETEFFCVDPSLSMLKISRRKFEKNGFSDRVHTGLGSSRELPFDGKYDLIITSLSFHHWKDKEKALLYLMGQLSDNGIISIYDPYFEEVVKRHRLGRSHSLSRSFLDQLNFEGFTKEVEYDGDLVNVKFQKIKEKN